MVTGSFLLGVSIREFRNARRLQQEMRQQPGLDDTLALLERLVAEKRPLLASD